MLSLATLVCSTAGAAEIIAHRGASADAPENTLAAMRLGYEQGADAGELDIHLTKDGKIVVIHDDNTKRTAGLDRPVAEQTLDEVRKLQAGTFGPWAGKGFAERVPTLEEVLPIVPAGKRLFIEIKCGPEILPALEATLRASKLTAEQTVIISFKYDVLKAARERFPALQLYWLRSYAKDKKTDAYPRVDDLIAEAKRARLDGLSLNHGFALDATMVKQIKDAGLKCHAWTVDEPARARELARAGVDGITTNRPAGLRRELASHD